MEGFNTSTARTATVVYVFNGSSTRSMDAKLIPIPVDLWAQQGLVSLPWLNGFMLVSEPLYP